MDNYDIGPESLEAWTTEIDKELYDSLIAYEGRRISKDTLQV